jgi:hypothetical protein
MWGFIIVIIALIAIKFIYDTAKQSSKIKSEGGVRMKYAILVDHFLSGDERCRIFQEDNTLVSVGISGPAGSQIYYIFPSYGNVSIRMEIKNNPLLGNMKMEWRFPEDMDQEHMIEKIDYDLEQRFSSLSNNL